MMFHGLRRTARRLRRASRPVLAALLMLAQGVAAFGCPVVVREGEPLRPCGCKVRGPLEACCCSAGSCCAISIAAEPPACPKCREKESGKPAAVHWLAAVTTRDCHGERPLGLMADIPAIPPAIPAPAALLPRAGDLLRPADLFASPLGLIPPEPPPRG